jgi:hypothetical protein
VGVVGLIGAVDAIWGPIWPTLPEIRVTGSDDASPFAFPFVIRNNSVLFGMRINGWTCIVGEMRFGTNIAHDLVAGSGGNAMIPPTDIVNYRCGIEVTGYHVSVLDLTVAATYENILRKGIVKQHFQWVDAGRNSKWIEGSEVH